MNTYVISSLKKTELKAARSLSSDLDFRELFSTAPSTINFGTKFNEDEDYIFVFSEEKVALKFFYLDEKRFFDLCTVNILNLDRMKIMLSLVKGIGILGRGGPLNYISSEIGPIIGSSLFDSSTIFEVRKFSDKEMQWQTWNGKLQGITFKPSDIESISVEGEKAESKIRELELYPNDKYKIIKMKIQNENFNRKIILEGNGKIKVALWPGEIGIHELDKENLFPKFVDKMIEFYEYTEEALGENYGKYL